MISASTRFFTESDQTMNKNKLLPVESLIKLVGTDPESRKLCNTLFDVWAGVKDAETSNRLLKNLVMRYAELEKQMRELNLELKHSQEALLKDLAAAAEIQKTLLPSSLPTSDKIEAAYEFIPCDKVGGDLINLFRYDDNRWLLWVLDVSGHGPRAAMVTMAVDQFLRSSSELNYLKPIEIMRALNKEFPFSRFESFFTLVYGVVDIDRQVFTYCNSAHPKPILLQPGCRPSFIDGHGPMLGLDFADTWPEVTADFSDGRGILIYTDGLFECSDKNGHIFGETRLLDMLESLQEQDASGLSAAVMAEMRNFMGKIHFQDDLTFLILKSRP